MPLGQAISVSEDDRPRGRRVVAALVLANAAVALVLAGLVGVELRASHAAYDALARDTAQNLAAIAQANVASELSRVDAVLQAALDEIDAVPGSGAISDATIQRTLEQHRQLLPAVEGLRLADARGLVRWGNDLPVGQPVDVSDRDYFVRAKARPEAGLLVDGPLRSRVSGHWVMSLVRPVVVAGRFEGILYASLSVAHFQKLFEGYDVDRDDAIVLRSTDLRLVARYAPGSPASADTGHATVSPSLVEALARNADRGVFVARTALDGLERTTAYRRVEGFPLVVLAGLGTKRFFAPWRAQAWQVVVLALVVLLLVAGASTLAYRTWHREARSLRALAAQTRRVQALLRIAGDGIHIVDRQGRLVGMSDSFCEMLHSTRERLLGRHISSWDVNQDEARIAAWLAKIKDGDRQRVEVQHRRDDGVVIDVELQLGVARLDGELMVFGSARDVTERKRLFARLEESAARVRDLYDNAPCGYHSLDGDGVFVHVNATLAGWLGCEAAEVVGRARLADFLDEPSRAVFAHNFVRLKRDGCLEGIELRLVPPRGRARRLRASVTAIRDAEGAFVMSRSVTVDVSEQHEAQLEAARLMREQAAMLDNDLVGMVKLRDRTAVWRNRALERMFGYEPGELDGSHARLLYPDDASFEALGAEAYPLLAAGGQYRTQRWMLRKDGRLIWVDLSGANVDEGVSFWMMVDITAMKDAQAEVEHIAFHDGLTGLPNRLLLTDRMREAEALAQRSSTRVAVCYLDLDGFKEVNDLHGHDAGDALLAEIGRRLQAGARGIDTAARVGGDEFVLLLTMLAEPDDWRPIVDRLVRALQEPVRLPGGQAVRVGASVGVAVAPDDASDPAHLLTLADQAMLAAKRLGKQRVLRASPVDASRHAAGA